MKILTRNFTLHWKNAIKNLFQKYDKLYHDSIYLKKIYTRLLNFITTKNKLPINDLDLNMGIDIDDEIKWKENFKDFYIFIPPNLKGLALGLKYLGLK